MLRLASLAFALAFVAAGTAAAQPAVETGPGIIVAQGRGSLERAPDQAWVTIAAESRANTPSAAQDLAAQAMSAVLQTLETQSVPDEAIRTTGYTLRPDMQYDDGRARVRGYIALNQIEVRVDDLTQLGAVIDAAGASGATSMSNLRFDVREREALQRDALRLAVEDAMRQAEAMAAGAGRTVGRVVRIEQQGRMAGPPPAPMMAMREAAMVETPINPGRTQIEANVVLTVAIE